MLFYVDPSINNGSLITKKRLIESININIIDLLLDLNKVINGSICF